MTETDFDLLYAGYDEQDQILAHLATSGGARIAHLIPPGALTDEDAAFALQIWLDYEGQHGEGPPPEILADEMARTDPFPDPIGAPEHWLGKVLQAHLRDLGGAVLSKASRMGESDPRAALEYNIEASRAALLIANPTQGVQRSRGIDGAMAWYQRRLAMGETGLTLGFERMDREVFALAPGQLTALVARLKRYKSWLMMKSAVESMRNGKRVTFANLELPEGEFMMRVACMLGDVSWERQHKRGLNDDELARVEEMQQWVRSLDNPIDVVRPDHGQRSAKFLARLAAENGSEALYVDQLDFMDRDRSRPEWAEYGRCALELKEAAMDSDIAVFVAVQFNRNAVVKKFVDLGAEFVGNADKIPQVSDTILASFATGKMKSQRIIHYGPIEARQGDSPRAWEVVVDLDSRADFRLGDEHDLQKDEEEE